MLETPATSIWLEGGVVFIRSKGVLSSPQSIETTLEAVKRLTGGARLPVIFDARKWPGGTTEAWVAIIAALEASFSAAAIIGSEDLTVKLGAYSETIDRLLIPFRRFSREADALQYLAQYGQAPERQE